MTTAVTAHGSVSSVMSSVMAFFKLQLEIFFSHLRFVDAMGVLLPRWDRRVTVPL